MYFQVNNVLKELFDVKLLTYQQLYDVRTWPLDLLKEKGRKFFPIRLEDPHNIYFTEFDETTDDENHVVVTYGQMTGMTSVDDEKIIPIYFIFEATLYQGCCDRKIICDTHTIRARGKIFFTPNLKVFDYCYNEEWDNDNKDLKRLNLCKFFVNNQINSEKRKKNSLQQFPVSQEKINLMMAKKEYDKICPIIQCCAKERIARKIWCILDSSR